MGYNYADPHNQNVDEQGNKKRYGTNYAPGTVHTADNPAPYYRSWGTAVPDSGTWAGAPQDPKAGATPAAGGGTPYGGATGLGGGGGFGMRTGGGFGMGSYGKPVGGGPRTLNNPNGGGAGVGMGTPAPGPDPYGTESGNTYLEDRYLNRLNGQDPAFNYALKRGGDAIDTRMAAAGAFNSGARGQQLSDFYANMVAQSQGQLDALAGGATGARQSKINSMLGTGLGIAGGEAGLSSAYDLGAAGNMDAANRAQQQMFLNKAGVDSQANQGRFNNLLSMYTAYNSGGGGQTQ